MSLPSRLSTGLRGLDDILDGLRPGDNVVWSVDRLEDYKDFARAFVQQALRDGRRVVYMRFGRHAPLIDKEPRIAVYELDALRGFESFATRIHTIATQEGQDVFYIFDCLSDLLGAWATDLMVGNFFRVTCPYLFELNTVAYFALMQGAHSFKTIDRIRQTTQLLLDLHYVNGRIHVQPLKVWNRRSPTMFLQHVRQDGSFVPIANSADATRLFNHMARHGAYSAKRQLDHWDLLFLQAEDLRPDDGDIPRRQAMVDRICRVMIGRDERMLALARRFFSLDDLLEIKSRLVGTGFIGGKAVGMLLARAILLADAEFDWKRRLEPHDSFYVGSDVFHDYIVHNGWWKLFMRHKTPEGYYPAGAELGRLMLEGEFPDEIRQELHQLLEYFGQYPIIVRSSSLLEDSFGNAFAGKYESCFCVNQGSPQERYQALENAIRAIFASSMSEDALAYRRQRGLDQAEEQMALLIQRVSGSYRRHYYFPELAGVAASWNAFVWSEQIEPSAGMVRLVLGMGTRAVDRVEDDYPRMVALDRPLMKPYGGFEDMRRFSQRDVDVLNIDANTPQTVSVLALAAEGIDLPFSRYGVLDAQATRLIQERGGKAQEAWLLTFDPFLAESDFVPIMRRMLRTLHEAYDYPVDVEFTVNFAGDGTMLVNVVQCRPLQTRGRGISVEMPARVADEDILFRSEGHFMGGSIAQRLARIIFVEPEGYVELPLGQKYEVARLIGQLNRLTDRAQTPTLLIGPGRWGTSTPALGVPVRFAEINNMAALAEVAFTAGQLMPDLSFGTHFFQDLVETDIFYIALFPQRRGCLFNRALLESLPSITARLLPDAGGLAGLLRVYDVHDRQMMLLADLVSQKLLCCRVPQGASIPKSG